MWKGILIIILLISSTALAAEYGGSLSVGSVSEPAIGLSGTSYVFSSGSVCTSDSQCPSGNCAMDFDGSGKWCADAGGCVHSSSASCDSVCYGYANSSGVCEYSNTLQTCRSGAWVASSCSCSNGACPGSSDSGSSSGSSGSPSVEKMGINSTCIYDSECSSGYCVHTKCRASATYCGDGYCDSGETCAADSSACTSDETCSDGCHKRLLSEISASQELAKRESSEIKSIIENNAKLQGAIQLVLKKNLTDEFKDKICNSSEKAVNNIIYKSNLVLDEEKGQSMIVLNITLTGSQKAKNLMVYDTIPKSFAQSSNSITVITDAEVTVVEKDPVYMILFENVYPNKTVSIAYRINDIVSNDTMNDITQPIILAEDMLEIVCGDGVCDYGELCAKDCKNDTIVYVGAVIIIAAVIIITVKFLPKRKTKTKPAKKAPLVKSYLPKTMKPGKKIDAKSPGKAGLAQKLKNLTRKRERKFVYKYEA